MPSGSESQRSASAPFKPPAKASKTKAAAVKRNTTADKTAEPKQPNWEGPEIRQLLYYVEKNYELLCGSKRSVNVIFVVLLDVFRRYVVCVVSYLIIFTGSAHRTLHNG